MSEPGGPPLSPAPAPFAVPPPPPGYLSEEAKRRFTLTAGILGAVFFIGQVVAPMLVSVAMMPLLMFSGDSPFLMMHLSDGAWWNGRLYVLETPMHASQGLETAPRLARLVSGPTGALETVEHLKERDVALLGGGDRLWLIGPASVGFTTGGSPTWVGVRDRLGSFAHPFLLRGVPALVEVRPEGERLRVWNGASWDDQALPPIAGSRAVRSLPSDLQIVAEGDTLHLFLRSEGSVFYRKGFPQASDNGAAAWENVARTGAGWAAALLSGAPTVFVTDETRMNSPLQGFRLDPARSGDRWRQICSVPAGLTMGRLIAQPTGEAGEVVLLLEGFPGRFRSLRMRDGRIEEDRICGGAGPFALFLPMMGAMFGIMLLMPLVLALILSSLMPRHRPVGHAAGPVWAEHASVGRRAIAQLVDAAILAGPLAAGYVTLFSNFMAPERMAGPETLFAEFGILGFGLAWAFVGFLACTALEGAWGVTPGKWLAGIRVLGTDLAPCGFGRAIIRNLLKFVDGFFNFMVGVLVVALSENWQRVGDMAARTVVVRWPLRAGVGAGAPDLPAPTGNQLSPSK